MLSRPWLVGLLGALSVLLAAAPAPAQLFRGDRCRSCECPPPGCAPEATPAPAPAPAPAPGRPGEPPAVPEAAAPPAPASPSPYEVGDLGGGALSTFDSTVGYIDNAIPSNLFRLRVDAAYRANRTTRAEFLYARGAPAGPGLPLTEVSDDYQEILAYLEGLVRPNLSVFVEAPVRFINPTINEDHAGFGDMNFGFKWAFLRDPDQVTSFQLRLWMPTGNAHLGLGNDHVSIEPALLCFNKLTDRLRVESELHLWVPVGGTDFAGPFVRYGVGFSYGERPADRWWAAPVVEFVGWTVLGGKEAVAPPIPSLTQNAAGDTIVNAKFGVRVGLGDRFDLYSGYGRALTGEVWYKDIWRTELRLAF